MGKIKMLINNFKSVFNSTNENNDWFSAIFKNSIPTASGEIVTPETAFSNIGTIFECVVIRGNSMAKLPLQLFKRTNTGKARDNDHKLSYLIEKRPNKYQTPSEFKKYIEVSKLLWGNAYIKMKFDYAGNIESLDPLNPANFSIEKSKINNEYIFKHSEDGKITLYSEEEIIHLPYITLDGKKGKAPLEVARESAGNLQAINKFEGTFYKNGTLTTGVLESPSVLKKEAKIKLKEEWANLYGGGNNAGSIAVLDAGFNYKPITIPLKDIEFIASRRMNKVEIATIFDVPLYMLNDVEGSKFNNVEQQNLRYLQDVLQPNLTAIEEEFNYKLFTFEESKKYYVKYNLNSALRADSKTRADFYEKMISKGLMTINEARGLEDLDTIGELGDKHYFSLNFTTLDTLEQHERIVKGGEEENEGQSEEPTRD